MQARAAGYEDGETVIEIIKNHLHHLEKHNYQAIVREMKISVKRQNDRIAAGWRSYLERRAYLSEEVGARAFARALQERQRNSDQPRRYDEEEPDNTLRGPEPHEPTIVAALEREDDDGGDRHRRRDDAFGKNADGDARPEKARDQIVPPAVTTQPDARERCTGECRRR